MAASIAPNVNQGILNRVQASIILPSYPALNITSDYMSKSFVTVAFTERFVDQPETATGLVQSPKPYVVTTATVGLLRSQALSGTYLSTVKKYALVGRVVVYPDADTFPVIRIRECSIVDLDPNTYDGQDPTVKVTFQGKVDVNENIWAGGL